jgi:hypothetical protein
MKYKTNVTLSHFSAKHGWREEAMSISKSECMAVALVIQHVMRISYIKLSSVACLSLQFFPHYLKNCTIYENKYFFEQKMRILIFSPTFGQNFLILRRTERNVTKNLRTLSCKVHFILVGLKLIFSTIFE